MKKTSTSIKVVKKLPSSEGQPSKKPIVGAEQSSRPRPSKKPKSELDEVLKSGKLEGKYTIVPPMSLSQIVDEVIKEGNLKHISEYYENCDENDEREIEEVIEEYMNIYKKTLIELSSMIMKGLYEILDARRHTASLEDERIK